MANSRKLGASERLISGSLSNSKVRDKVAAQRQIENLGQNDQIIALLRQINDRLGWICDDIHRKNQVP